MLSVSSAPTKIEHMCERWLDTRFDTEAPQSADDAVVVAAISEWWCGACAVTSRAHPKWCTATADDPSGQPRRTGVGLPPVGSVGHARAVPRHDLPVPQLRPARKVLRCRSHDPLSARPDASIELEMFVQKTLVIVQSTFKSVQVRAFPPCQCDPSHAARPARRRRPGPHRRGHRAGVAPAGSGPRTLTHCPVSTLHALQPGLPTRGDWSD
jgi:hypothetical protein